MTSTTILREAINQIASVTAALEENRPDAADMLAGLPEELRNNPVPALRSVLTNAVLASNDARACKIYFQDSPLGDPEAEGLHHLRDSFFLSLTAVSVPYLARFLYQAVQAALARPSLSDDTARNLIALHHASRVTKALAAAGWLPTMGRLTETPDQEELVRIFAQGQDLGDDDARVAPIAAMLLEAKEARCASDL